jgi:hypothetical protein
MVGMAIAVNWMARAQVPEAARMLVTATRRQISLWAAGRPWLAFAREFVRQMAVLDHLIA